MTKLILAINPGSTSTKIAVYDAEKELFVKTLRHSNEELEVFTKVSDQYQFRKDAITTALVENNIKVSDLSAIVARGGLLKPIPSGVYEVNEEMIKDLTEANRGEHASNLGGIIAANLSLESKSCKAYIADPVVVDELEPIARISGHPLFSKRSIFHALNQKAIAKIYAASQNREYKSMNLIVTHLGGGVSVGAHCNGKVVDVNNALDGEGPFSPERSGTLPAKQLADLCFSGEYTLAEVGKMINGKGGMVAHLGTNSFNEIERKVLEGDAKFTLYSDAFAYNVSKEIGAMATVLKGKVDAILITGGIAHNGGLMDKMKEYISFIAPVVIYPGEDEMGALAMNGLAILNGKESSSIY